MKLYLITDNIDTATGLRLAGIDGKVVSDASSAQSAVEAALAREDIAVLILSESVSESCSQLVGDYKRKHSMPLIVDLPGEN